LWRAGLRVQEALALAEHDLDQRRGSLLVRCGKGGRGREVGMDEWAWELLRPWLTARAELPPGPLFCIIDGATRGRAWSAAGVRCELRRLAARAGVRRRFAPHQLRHAHALELAREGVPLNIIQRRYEKYRPTTGVLISSRRLASGLVLRVTGRDTPARQRRPGLTFFPSLGGLRETFIASFVARYRTLTLSQDGREGDYYFLARGPRGCRKINTYPGDQSVRGDRVLIGVDPNAIDTGSHGYRRRWCPGRYVGRIVYVRDNRKGHTVFRHRIASHIVFTVQPLVLPWW
jgi:hypothetical protein